MSSAIHGSRKRTAVRVETCDVCGVSLDNVPCRTYGRRTKVDVIFEKTVEHIDAETKQCPNSQAIVKGSFLEDMPGRLQYGSGLKASAIHLIISEMVALNRSPTSDIGDDRSGHFRGHAIDVCSEIAHGARSLGSRCDRDHAKGTVGNVSDTSCRVEKKNHWIHVYCSHTTTMRFLHRKRGRDNNVDMDIIPRYG